MNITEPPAQEAPTIIGVSAAITFGEANVIIPADDIPTLRDFFSDHKIADASISEIRQTVTLLGPMLELARIAHIQEMAAGLTAAQSFVLTHGDRTIGNECTKEEEDEAKRLRLVIVFGYSDDCTEFRGIIHDEVGTGDLYISENGKLLDNDKLEALESLVADGTIPKAPLLAKIHANYGDDGVWQFTTDIPHATFDVTEDGDLYCKAIVFSILDLNA